MVAGFLMFGREDFFRLPSAYGLVALILILALLTWFSLRRPKVGLWVLAGMAALTVGTLFTLFRNLDWMPVTFATQYGPQVGGALEIPLILIGLYFRSRERRDNRVRLDALAHTDPLTGVGNHRVLVERLEQSAGTRPARALPGRAAAGACGQPGRDPRRVRARSGRSRDGARGRMRGAGGARRRHGGARAGRRPGAGAGRRGVPGPGRRGGAQHHCPRAQVLGPAAPARDAACCGWAARAPRCRTATRRCCWACWAA